MRSIIITGKQGTGKTTLANIICENRKTVRISNRSEIKEVLPDTEAIVFEIESEKDFIAFTEFSQSKTLTHRPPYYKEQIKFDCDKILLIGISQSPIEMVKDCFIYNLY